MSEQTYLKILRWGIYLSLLTPLLIFKSLLFPFITSKAFYFRIIIEILLAVYIFFIYQYPKNIPKKKALTVALLFFAGIFVLTSFTGIDFNLSFWGDIERMEGTFGFLHLIIFFIIIISVFKTKDDWKKLLNLFLGTCVLLAFYGLGQKLGFRKFLLYEDPRISSTLGNAAYLGGISLFAIALSLIFFFKEKDRFVKFGYFSVFILNLVILFLTGTRGAYLGLAVAIAFCLLLYIIMTDKRKIKIAFFVCLCVFVAGGILLLVNSESQFIRNNQYLYRLSHISLEDATLNTRLISWKAGWKGFLEKPMLGVGSGNYAYFFDKYFPPVFYSYTASQTYFDHAHNTLVDITATMGILGILSYMAILCIVIAYLISNFKREVIDLNEFIILAGLLVAYFIQNIFVFDSLATFIAFFVFIGYIAYPQYNKFEELSGDKNNRQVVAKRKINPILATSVLLFSGFLVIKYNIIPAKAMAQAVDGQYIIAREKDLEEGYNLYKEALAHKTVLDRDIRSSFINIIAGNGFSFYQSMEKEKFMEILDFAISEGEKNLDLNQNDAMMNLQMGQLYNFKVQITKSGLDVSKGEFYLKKALDASPGRLQIYFILAQNRLLAGEKEQALEILENAKNLNSNYTECYTNLARAYAYAGDTEKEYGVLLEASEKGMDIFSEKQLYEALNYFTEKKEYDKLELLYDRFLQKDVENASLMARLAVVYANLGKMEEAKEMVKKAIEIDPKLEQEGKKFLEELGR